MNTWTDEQILEAMVDLYLPPQYENRVLALLQRVRDDMAQKIANLTFNRAELLVAVQADIAEGEHGRE